MGYRRRRTKLLQTVIEYSKEQDGKSLGGDAKQVGSSSFLDRDSLKSGLTRDTIRCKRRSELSRFSVGKDKKFQRHTRDVVAAVNEYIEQAKAISRIANCETDSVRGLVSLYFPELLGYWEKVPES